MKRNGQIVLYVGIVIFFCIIFLLCYLLSSSNDKEVELQESLKADKDSSPQLTLKGEDILKVNKKIKEMYEFGTKKNQSFDYQMTNNDDIISFVAINGYYEGDAQIESFILKTFNIDKTTGKLIDDQTLYQRYNVNKRIISEKIKGVMELYYNDEIKQGYLSANQCNFNCFLRIRGIDQNDYSKDSQVYIGDNSIFVYKTFNIMSVYADEGYYLKPIDAFRFLIK